MSKKSLITDIVINDLVVNIGVTANDKHGDPLRTAFTKLKESIARAEDNFTELYDRDVSTQYHLGDDIQFVDIDPDSGTVVIQSGFDTGMPVYIKGANCSDGGFGGNVYIEAGGAPLPNNGTTGNIELAAQQTTIDSNNNVWTFGDSGVLELPEDTGYIYIPASGGIIGTGVFDESNLPDLAIGATNSVRINTNSIGNMWTFDKSGTIHTPLKFPLSFTAVLDVEHRTSGGDGTYTGPAWEFNLEWQVSPSGQIELLSDTGPLPSLVVGYADGQTFEFTETDHGIPDYTLTVTLSDVQHNPAGWTANLSFSEPPSYPSTINTLGAIKLTSNNNSWILGTDGKLTLPLGGDIVDSNGDTVLGGTGGSSDRLVNGNAELVLENDGEITSVAFPARDGGKIYLSGVEIGAIPSDPEDTFPYPLVLTSQQGNVRITPNAIQAPRLDWTFGTDGTLTLPNGSTIGDKTGTGAITIGPAVDTFNINNVIGTFPGLDFSSPNGVAVGWLVNGPGVTNATILGINASDKFIEIDGGTFQVGESYTFTGISSSISIGTKITVNSNDWTFGTDGTLTLPAGGAITSPDCNFSFNKDTGNFALPTLGTVISSEGLEVGNTGNSEVYMGSGFGEFRSIYNNNSGTESGLTYAGVEGFNYVQQGDVNFSGIVSQTPNIDSMYSVGLNEDGQIVIGFTQNGQTQESTDWSVTVGTLNTDMTVNGLFANTTTTVIGSGLSSWQFGTDGKLTLPQGGVIKNQVLVNVTLQTFYNFPLDGVYYSETGAPWLSNMWSPGLPVVLTMVNPTGDFIALNGGTFYISHVGGELVSLCTDSGLTSPINVTTGTYDSGTLVSVNYDPQPYISIQPSTSDNTWAFRADGKLQLPSGGDIVDSNGLTVLGGTGGGTIWTNDANGCLRAELSATGFEAFTDQSHVDLKDSGIWSIGSYGNSTFIGNNEFANLNDLSLRSGDATFITTNLRENGNYQWKFGTDGKLTFPGADGFQATFGSVEPIGDVLHSINDLVLKSDHGVTIVSGEGIDALETSYNDQLTDLTSLLSAELYGTSFLPASHDSIIALAAAKAVNPLISDQIITVAQAVSDAWDAWQEALSLSAVTIGVGNLGWYFNSDGKLTLPSQGKIGGSDVNSFLTFNYGDDVELKAGDNLYLSGSVATIRTNSNANQWTFGTDGSLTLPSSESIFDRAGIDSGLNIRSNDTNGTIYLYSYGTDGDGTGAGNIYINPTSIELYSSWNNGGAGEKKWTFGSDGTLNLPDSISAGNAIIQTTSPINIQVNSNAHVWTFGTDGDLTFPNGALKIAGNTISNLTGVGTSLVAGSQLEVAPTKTVITYGTTNYLDDPSFPSLISQYLSETSANGILNAYQVTTMLDATSGLTSQHLTELDQTSFKIGLRVTNILDSSPPVTGFSGWTFGTVDTLQAITFPQGTVIRETPSEHGLYRTKYSGTFVLDPTWFAANAGNIVNSDSFPEGVLQNYDEVETAFSFQYFGYFVPPTSANYTFRAHADETFIFWIGSKALSGYTYANKDMYGNYNGTFPEQQTQSFTIALTAGEFYPIRIQWANSAGWGQLDVFTWGNDAGQAATADFTGRVFRENTGTAKIAVNDNKSIILSTDNATDNNWTFAPNGALSFPGSLTVEPNNNSPIFRTNNNFNIITDDTGNTWTFDSSGTLTIPGDETITDTKVTNWDTAYEWGDHSIAGYVTGTPWTEAGYVTGTPWTEAGYLTAEADTLDSVTTRGNTTTNDITVGDLTVSGEIKSAAGTGDVVIEANNGTARTWTFGGDGTLTFPDTSVQTTAYNRTTGSWTLAPGANTVNITVTPGRTYSMWVHGNIDNGIVMWNATVSLSNTNVPALGTQYGWYYSGNQLVLNSIPNQIVGTAGSISTATVATTTSNVFTFGITNNSNSSQIVYWGYVEQ